MVLTTQQIEAIRDGQPVTIQPPEIGADCILVRADVYARIGALLTDVEMDPRDAYPHVDRVMADDDAGDPTLDDYQHYQRQP